ncbi:MAG: pantoate--beta-alanine ligase [Bacteroidales bacterium]|nr:pantoate--beta-alanine ligase [Bacteroidales bacterium]
MFFTGSIKETRHYLESLRTSGKLLGFVPTMGALHEGHLRLVERARRENSLVACSIFVNPIQFNNPEDLEKYPRTVENDIELLQDTGCDLVFVPSVEEMYPGPVTEKYDFGALERVMEGASRPGHFNGVAIVVKKLFDIIQPDTAYFGEKDFQQLRIIQSLVKMEQIPVTIIPCPTVREPDGLAMSSRNRRLSPLERSLAPEIYHTLLSAREMVSHIPLSEIKRISGDRLEKKGFRVDYFEIADIETLQPAGTLSASAGLIACVAAFLGNVRLIDNMILFPNFAR